MEPGKDVPQQPFPYSPQGVVPLCQCCMLPVCAPQSHPGPGHTAGGFVYQTADGFFYQTAGEFYHQTTGRFCYQTVNGLFYQPVIYSYSGYPAGPCPYPPPQNIEAPRYMEGRSSHVAVATALPQGNDFRLNVEARSFSYAAGTNFAETHVAQVPDVCPDTYEATVVTERQVNTIDSVPEPAYVGMHFPTHETSTASNAYYEGGTYRSDYCWRPVSHSPNASTTNFVNNTRTENFSFMTSQRNTTEFSRPKHSYRYSYQSAGSLQRRRQGRASYNYSDRLEPPRETHGRPKRQF